MSYKPKKFEEIKVGDEFELTHQITQEDIQKFCDLTGDQNPLHLDKGFAQQTDFRKPVAYGMLSASFISTMIGNHIPGTGALWLSQTINFMKQTYVGDTIRLCTKVKQTSSATRILILETTIFNQKNEIVLTGESQVRLLEIKENDEMQKKNKTILITGASRGIGAAMALQLARDGHQIIVNYATSEDDARAVVQAIESSGGKAIAVKADVTDETQVKNLINEVVKSFGTIDVLIHNASGQINVKPITESTWSEFQSHLDVQVKGFLYSAQSVLPSMIEAGGGVIIAIGSIASDNVPPAQQSSYVTAKSALSALAKCLAVEYGPKNIRVNVIAPGMTQTDLIADLPQKAKELTRMNTPLRRLAQPEDIANVASFLASDQAKHISGETIRVCGGSTMI